MKKMLVVLLSAILFLQGCSTNESDQELVEWGEYSTSQEERLKKNRIDFKVEDDTIYIEEKDLNKAVACCS
ncbi:hypothetical protein [Exiguobacterium sp. s142]|uniref:hypothetical protein n=1 Tax=Exiguobacterium sp. s142 TaxID=2751222 RepID=UPI001BEADA24|nr:hypothetical protein [Exiguobacterium sp. s142]